MSEPAFTSEITATFDMLLPFYLWRQIAATRTAGSVRTKHLLETSTSPPIGKIVGDEPY
jgi:hypothetical protein